MLKRLTTPGETIEIKITMGDKMRRARVAAGAQQTEMAEALDISRQTVIDWELGHRRPSKIAVFAWAHVTGVDFEWLWNDADQSTSGAVTAGEGGFLLRRNRGATMHGSTPRKPRLSLRIRVGIPYTFDRLLTAVAA